MLPCSDYPDRYTAGSTDSMPRVFTRGDFFVANPTNNVYKTDVIENKSDDIVNDCAEPSVAAPSGPGLRQMEEMLDAHAVRQPAAASE